MAFKYLPNIENTSIPTTPDAELTHTPTRYIDRPIRTLHTRPIRAHQTTNSTNQSPHPGTHQRKTQPIRTRHVTNQSESSILDQSERSHPRVHRIAQPHLSKTVYRLTPKNAPPSRKTCYPHEKHATLTNNARKFEGIERCFPTKCFPSPHSVTSQKKEKRKKKRRNKRKRKKERERKKERKKKKKEK